MSFKNRLLTLYKVNIMHYLEIIPKPKTQLTILKHLNFTMTDFNVICERFQTYLVIIF